MTDPIDAHDKLSSLLKTLPDLIERLYQYRGTRRALVAFILLLNVLLSLVFWLVNYILTRAELVSSPDNFLKFVGGAGIVWIVCHVALVGIWLFWRDMPRISPEMVGVLFAAHGEPECDDVLSTLYDQFRLDLEARSLNGLIAHSLLPQRYLIKNHAEATKILETTGARLVVYGNVQQGRIKGLQTKGFKQISFTVRHRQLNQEEILPLAKTIAGALALRAFSFNDTNSFIEKSVVAENISEVSRFFIGAALALDGKVQESISLLEELRIEVEVKKAKTKPKEATRQPQLDLFYASIKDVLKYAYTRRLSMFYDTEIVDFITRRTIDQHVKRYEELVDQLEKVTQDRREWDLSRAIVAFHFGNYPEANRLIKNAKEFFPKTNPAPYLSKAFLALWQGSYPTALKDYYKASRCKEVDTSMIIGIIRFFHGIIEEHPEKRQLRFGLAFINDWFFDQESAEREYDLFLRDTTGVQERGLQVLRQHADIRLRELRRT